MEAVRRHLCLRRPGVALVGFLGFLLGTPWLGPDRVAQATLVNSEAEAWEADRRPPAFEPSITVLYTHPNPMEQDPVDLQAETRPTEADLREAASAPAQDDPRLSESQGLLPTWKPERVFLPAPPSPDPLRRFADLFATPTEVPAPLGDSAGVSHETIVTIPIFQTHKVEQHMRFFHTAIRDRFEQWLDRLGRYRSLVERIFSEFDLPSDLVYLSLVESGFNPHAYSRARASGPWQFMKGTAKLYGLRVDQYVDERRDPIKSTVAAARYLRDLYDLFGTWPLAMAAYNAGEGKILRALRKARTDSFWDIAQTRHLRRETKEYVPRFLAAAMIAKNPDQYGFHPEQAEPHQFEEVVVHRPVHLRDLAKITGLSSYELRGLNPELRRDVTPPGDAEYRLKVPVGTKATVEQMLERIPTWKGTASNVKTTRDRGGAAGWHRVRVGDSLWKIAKRYGLSVRELVQRNNLVDRLIKPGDLLAVGP